MIYFVDDDIGQAASWCFSLNVAGFETMQIRDANSAYNILMKASDIEIVFIDVMLAVDETIKSDRDFTLKRTDDNVITGLCLLDDLHVSLGAQFLNKCVLLSCTGQERVLSNIQSKSKEHNVPFWPKFSFDEPQSFIDKVKEQLKK